MARTLEQTAERPADSGRDRGKWLVLVAMVFGLFMPMLDNLVVNVALPTIQRDLGSGFSGLQWIIDGYTLTFASFMLTGGALGDLFGRKRFFMLGLVVFLVGSLLCGLSASIGQLIAFRAFQGMGAALLLPGSLSIITATFRGEERGAAIGIWAAMSGLAVAIGPVVGGYLVEHVSWESIFFINVPIGLAGLALTWFVVGETRDETKSRKVDPPGLLTGTAGLFFLVFALIEGNSRGWTDGLILAAFAVAAVLLASFIVIESRRESPMLPLSFFRIPTFAASNAVAAAVFFAMFGTVFFLALYLQNILGYSPAGAGVRMFAFSAVMLVVAPNAGRLSDRYGSRWFMTVGPLIAAVGMLLLLRTDVDSSYWTVILPAFLVLAAGLSMTMTPMTAAVMASVDARHAGVASAATNTSRELGGVLGIALLGAVVTSVFSGGFQSRLVEAGFPHETASRIVAAAGSEAASGGATAQQFLQQAPPGTTIQQAEAVVTAVKESFVHSLHVGMLVAVGFLVLASVVSFLFVRSHVGAESHTREAA
jgi:EmrB/QacA subfamily drug resistance transporter